MVLGRSSEVVHSIWLHEEKAGKGEMEVDVRLRVGAVTGIGKEVCSVWGEKHEKQGFDSMK